MGRKAGSQVVKGNRNVRQCVDCKRLFELNGDNFFVQRYHMRCSGTYTSRFHSRCKGCHNLYEKARYQRKKELNGGMTPFKDSSRNARARRLYGLSLLEVEAMYNEGCMICGTKDRGSTNNKLHIDHNHTTGKVRGCLCVNCNRGLGHFMDDTNLLEKAIQYLKERNS